MDKIYYNGWSDCLISVVWSTPFYISYIEFYFYKDLAGCLAARIQQKTTEKKSWKAFDDVQKSTKLRKN